MLACLKRKNIRGPVLAAGLASTLLACGLVPPTGDVVAQDPMDFAAPSRPTLLCFATNVSSTLGPKTVGTTTTPNGSTTQQFTVPVTTTFDCYAGPGDPECGICLYANSYQSANATSPDVLIGSNTGYFGSSNNACGSTVNTYTINVSLPASGSANSSNFTLKPGYTYTLQIWVKPYQGTPCSDTSDPSYQLVGTVSHDVPA